MSWNITPVKFKKEVQRQALALKKFVDIQPYLDGGWEVTFFEIEPVDDDTHPFYFIVEKEVTNETDHA